MLQPFYGSVVCVGHVNVLAAGAWSIGTATTSATDRFVVGTLVVSDDQVVHRPLRLGGNPVGKSRGQRQEQHIDQSLGGFHVATGDGTSLGRIEQATGRNVYLDGPQCAAAGRNIVPCQGT